MSDLHLEGHPSYAPRPAPQAELLVLAGDIGSYQNGSRLADGDFGLQRFSPLHGWPVPVLYVPGNHEYDALDFDATHARLRAACERLGITWLEREVRVIGGIRFVGTTLWADFDALALQPGRPEPTLGEQLKLRHKAFRAANFYLRKAAAMRHGRPMLPRNAQQALVCWPGARALAQPFAGTTVVVTHFAPSLRSCDPIWRDAGDSGTAIRWRICWRRRSSGCTATCIASMTTWSPAAACSPTRLVMQARGNRKDSAEMTSCSISQPQLPRIEYGGSLCARTRASNQNTSRRDFTKASALRMRVTTPSPCAAIARGGTMKPL